MSIAGIWAGWLSVVLISALPESAPSWSPDGQWLLYVSATEEPGRILERGWIYEPELGASEAPIRPVRYRLWATHLGSRTSVLLADSRQPIGAASWRADGASVAYCRQVDVEGQAGSIPTLQVVVQDDPGQVKVIYERALKGPAIEFAGLVAETTTSWSADGRNLAVSGMQPGEVAFLRVENGRVLRTEQGARAPSWSPGGKQVAFYRAASPSGLCLLDENFGEPTLLLPLPDVADLPAPVWAQDGRSVFAVVIGLGETTGRRRTRGVPIDLVELDLAGGVPESVFSLVNPPLEALGQLRSISLTADEQRDIFLFATNVEGRVTEITWADIRRGESKKRFYPSDPSFMLGALTLSPHEMRVALRIGSDARSTVAVVDPDSGEMKAVIPDVFSRLTWLALLADALRQSLSTDLGATEKVGLATRPSRRISLLPAAAELDARNPELARLRRLGRTGMAAGLGVATGEFDPGVERSLLEARLLFSYLDGGQDSVTREAIDGLTALTSDQDERERLACLRVQLDMVAGEKERARAAIQYLQQNRLSSSRVVEETSRGIFVRETPDEVMAWLDYLRKTLEAEGLESTPAGSAESSIEQTPQPPEPGIPDRGEIPNEVRIEFLPVMPNP